MFLLGFPTDQGEATVRVAGADAGGDAASRAEDVFGVGGVGSAAGAVGFGEGAAGEPAPVEFDESATAAIVGGARLLGNAESEALIT